MATYFDTSVRTELVNRRQKLKMAIASSAGRMYLSSLLHEVDAALSRLDSGHSGCASVP